MKIKNDAGTLLEEYTYGANRQRLRKEANSQRTYYAWGGSSVLMEYFETTAALTWAKSYIYAGSRLLSTITNTAGSEVTEYHHPDRLGTRLITNPATATQVEQNTLPFGTSIDAETSGTSNQRFTSYDRSGATGLDYAMNRTYNSGQSRFTQVDPIGMASASIGNPQSLNLFAYVQNNPIDFIDPSGLNMSSASFVCYDIVTTGHYTNDPDTTYVNTTRICFGGGGGGSIGGGGDDIPRGGGGGGRGGGGGSQQPKPKPCKYQNFKYERGATGLSAAQTEELVQTAVGEASSYYAKGEVSNLIKQMVNMAFVNFMYRNGSKDFATYGKTSRGKTVKPGTGTFDNIINEFDGRSTRFNSGNIKVEGEKKKNNGILPANSYVCKQLVEAVDFLAEEEEKFKDLGLFSGRINYNPVITQNRGKGAYHKNVNNLTHVETIGDTRFYVHNSHIP